jgi:hypothetical protein
MKNSQKNPELMGNELILCTGLPGNQSISRQTCGRRYLLAKKRARVFSKTGFDIGRMSSLEMCYTCLEGSINAKRYKDKLLEYADYHDDSAEHGKKRKK